MIMLAWFTIKILVNKEIGSIGALYDAIIIADKEKPVVGNYQGSHLTMRSNECLYFGILHIMYNSIRSTGEVPRLTVHIVQISEPSSWTLVFGKR
jgi:hypothetical protein